MRLFALILAVCATASVNWSESSHAASRAAAEQRFAHISVMIVGKGDPLVLIPGLSTPREVWDGVAPDLAQSHQLLLVQVNGFAGDDPGANLDAGILDGIVADLSNYVTQRHLGSVRIIGHSMGGLVALKFAQAHPEQVKSLMVVDALPFFGVLTDRAATADSVRPAAEMMRARVASSYGKPVDPAVVEANVRSLALNPEAIARMKVWAAAADPRVTAQALYENLTSDMRPLLPTIVPPVTFLVPWNIQGFGEERTLAFYKAQYAGLPKASFVGVADAGHFVMLDQPEAFAAAVWAFLR